jgi:hypothetical protein
MAVGTYTNKALGGNPGFADEVQNGRIPTRLLRRLETQPQMPDEEQWLWRDAAIGLDAMTRAAKAEGVRLLLHEAYRTLARQNYFWGEYQAGRGNLAAEPGTSNHGWASAIDVDRGADTKAIPWMRKNAPRFGWDLPKELGKREPWHWEWIRGFSVASLTTAKPIPVYVGGKLVEDAGAWRDPDGDVWVRLRAICDLKQATIRRTWDDGAELAYSVQANGTAFRTVPFINRAGIGYSPVKELSEALGVRKEWRDGAVRIS